jgi:hypothetical protein
MSDKLASSESVSLGKLMLRLAPMVHSRARYRSAERSCFEASGSSSATQIGALQC